MVVQYIQRTLKEKSIAHIMALKKLGLGAEDEPLSKSVLLMEQTPQFKGMNTIIQDIGTPAEEFVFYFDRIATLLVEQYVIIALFHNVNFFGLISNKL